MDLEGLLFIVAGTALFLLVKNIIWPLLPFAQKQARKNAVQAHQAVATAVEPGMTTDKFWFLIESAWNDVDPENLRAQWISGAFAQNDSDDEPLDDPAWCVEENLDASLELLNESDVLEFYKIAQEVHASLDSPKIQQATGEDDSDFYFLRLSYIIVGQDYVSRVIRNPSLARDHITQGWLLASIEYAYEELTGKQLTPEVEPN